MDALVSFFRDVWNWFVCIVLFGGFALYWLLRAYERRVAAHEERQAAPETPATPAAVTPTPAASPAPTVAAISPYSLPDEPAEMRAWATGLPAEDLIELDGAWFTPAEIMRIADVWERAANLRT